VYYLYASSDKNFPLGGGRFGSRYGNLYGVKSLAANTWTHVATTYDTTTQRLFINGSQVAQRSQTGLIAGSSGSLRIGGSSVWGRFFKGRIDEIRIYNRALTAAEITADMNNAVTPASAPAQIATSLLASPNLEALQAALRASGAPSGDTPRLPKSKSSSGDTSSASETMAELLTADHVETAEVFVDHEWKRVAFNKPFVDPIVVAKTISYQGAEPATVRIRAVDATGFEVRLQSWPDADRVHMPEAMGYLVIERGRYTLAGGTTIEAATAEVSRAHSTVSLAFSHPFQMAPVVMTAVASANGADAVTGRPGRVSKSGFQFHLQQQAAPAQDESQETISYIAWELSSGTLDGLTFEVRRTVEVRRDEFYTLPLREPFADTPVFLADVQATGGGNPLNLRWERKDVDGIHVKIDDERSDEAGRERGPDVVGYIAIK
jgi:hypothetical protein